jgi:hypothetical protein
MNKFVIAGIVAAALGALAFMINKQARELHDATYAEFNRESEEDSKL